MALKTRDTPTHEERPGVNDMTTIEQQKRLVKDMCTRYRSRPWKPISQKQRESSQDRPARGPVWISRMKFPAPASPSLRDALYLVIEALKSDYHQIKPPAKTQIQDVGVEFIGVRSGVTVDAAEPSTPEDEKLQALEKECTSDMTILYAHGGGLYYSSPSEYRSASVRLARLTKARVASIRYRLSPNHTFPAALLDILVAYASLIAPPPGALWSAVPAEKIVLAGNSAGANLMLGLTKFLLEFAKMSPGSVISDFHSKSIKLALPVGLTVASGWCDPCDALPSWHSKGEYDILGVLQLPCMPNYPTDELWPTQPPREHPYCVAASLDHELICPAAVRDWRGAPSMWFTCGSEERSVDSNRVVASQAAKSGVTVIWNEYEGMPHDFPLLMGNLPQAKHAIMAWAEACVSMIDARSNRPLQSLATKWMMPNCQKKYLGHPRDFSPLPFDEVRKKMKEYNETRPVWTGKLGIARL